METDDGRCLRSEVGRMRTEGGEGRDTERCGDPKIWFPMRVTYQREMKVKAELDRLGIECFIPMKYRIAERRGDGTTELRRGTNTIATPHSQRENLTDDTNIRRELVPAINNLIFVRSTQERISGLKASNEVLEPLRYMMDRTASREHAIMTVGDREMENFMRVASRTDDSVMFLDEETVVGKEGKRVEIMGGAFEGVTGVIRRVKRCKRVCVEIEGVASVAIAYVRAELLKELES
jgi:transcription antitermination factor NusG